MKIRPFDAGQWFPIHNYVFDVCMPSLSYPGWKVLCVAIRQTWGWADKNDPSGLRRREWDTISYSQFRDKAGISSNTTISRALKENMEAGYIVQRQTGRHPGTGKPLYEYALNRDFEAEIADEDDAEATTSSVLESAEHKTASTGGVLASSTGNVLDASTGGVQTKQKKQKKQTVGVVVSELTRLGMEPTVAEELVGEYDHDDILAFVTYVDGRGGRGLDNKAGYIISRLRSGAKPPTNGRGDQLDGEPDRRRYIQGEYADFIQH